MSQYHTGAPYGVQKRDKDTFIFREGLVKEEFMTEIDEFNIKNEIRKLTCLQPQCQKVFIIKSGSITGNIYKHIKKMHPGIPVTKEEAGSLRATSEAVSSQNRADSSSIRGEVISIKRYRAPTLNQNFRQQELYSLIIKFIVMKNISFSAIISPEFRNIFAYCRNEQDRSTFIVSSENNQRT